MKIFAVLISGIVMSVFPAAAQKTKRSDFIRNNSIQTGISFVVGSHNMAGGSVSLGYMRHIEKSFYWGAGLSTLYADRLFDSGWPERVNYDVVAPNITTVTGMVYAQPRVFRWLSLRTGSGIDVSYHKMVYGRDKHLRSRIFPFLCLDVKWVFHVGRHFDIITSPLILGPSRCSWTPFNYGPPTTLKTIWRFDVLQLTFGYRFK